MHPQISEDFLLRIFVETDDLYKDYISWAAEHKAGRLLLPKRPLKLSAAEVATIVVSYHQSGYKCFEYYYQGDILGPYLHCFPAAPSYKRFVSLIIRVLPLLLLILLYKCSQSLRAHQPLLYRLQKAEINCVAAPRCRVVPPRTAEGSSVAND